MRRYVATVTRVVVILTCLAILAFAAYVAVATPHPAPARQVLPGHSGEDFYNMSQVQTALAHDGWTVEAQAESPSPSLGFSITVTCPTWGTKTQSQPAPDGMTVTGGAYPATGLTLTTIRTTPRGRTVTVEVFAASSDIPRCQ